MFGFFELGEALSWLIGKVLSWIVSPFRGKKERQAEATDAQD